MTVNLTDPIFNDEEAARKHFEALRWPDGPVCPHCGIVGDATELRGKSTRPGVYKCKACRKPFTATIGTVYERSHIPMHKWLLATHLMCSSKKGISAHQLFRSLGFGSYKTAWFMAHRIREAMKDDGAPLGGEGKTVETDETFYGYKEGGPTWILTPTGWQKKRGYSDKMNVVTLVERGGKARSVKTETVTAREVRDVVLRNADTKSALMTDEAHMYRGIGRRFASHDSVNHGAEEWVRGDAHTNTVEGYFSIFKRGMIGIYQHCGEQHLHRYLTEFDFRYSNRIALGVDDTERSARAIRGVVGKRLLYRQPDFQA
jgi:transposase-like protein